MPFIKGEHTSRGRIVSFLIQQNGGERIINLLTNLFHVNTTFKNIYDFVVIKKGEIVDEKIVT